MGGPSLKKTPDSPREIPRLFCCDQSMNRPAVVVIAIHDERRRARHKSLMWAKLLPCRSKQGSAYATFGGPTLNRLPFPTNEKDRASSVLSSFALKQTVDRSKACLPWDYASCLRIRAPHNRLLPLVSTNGDATRVQMRTTPTPAFDAWWTDVARGEICAGLLRLLLNFGGRKIT